MRKFLTEAQLIDHVSEYPGLDKDEVPVGTLLLYVTNKQKTWLIATSSFIFCLLDNKVGISKELVQWVSPFENVMKRIKAKETKKYVGEIDLGKNHRYWLYSINLYPYPEEVETSVKKLIELAKASKQKEVPTSTTPGRGPSLVIEPPQKPIIGKFYFLGVGINNYNGFRRLNNAVKDVQDIKNLLAERYGLKEQNSLILTEKSATRNDVIQALYEVNGELTEEDRLLIYFAGHGYMKGGNGYWLTVDSTRDKYGTYINNIEIRHHISNSKARHILLISDSCFSEMLQYRSGGEDSTRVYDEWERKQSRWIMSSGKDVVSDGPRGQNSPFAKAILSQLQQNTNPILNIVLLADTVSHIVGDRYSQQPECAPLQGAGHHGGQFLFYLDRNS